MKRTEYAWVRFLNRFGGRVVRLTITYDDGKPKKRKAKR